MPSLSLSNNWQLLANCPPGLYTERHIQWYGLSLWPVRVSCPVFAASLLLVHLLTIAAWETHVTDTCLILNPKHSAVLASKKKINSISAETSILGDGPGPCKGVMLYCSCLQYSVLSPLLCPHIWVYFFIHLLIWLQMVSAFPHWRIPVYLQKNKPNPTVTQSNVCWSAFSGRYQVLFLINLRASL